MNIIPAQVVDAFARGEILQVLFFSVLFGLALLKLGDKAKTLITLIDQFSHALFGIVGMVMRLAPIGAFGAMAFTIGQYGIGTLFSLGKLMAAVYITCLAFVFIVLGTIAWWAGFSLWKFLKYIKEEILIVLGTASSEAVLPRMMAKLEHLGCQKSVVGLVIPTGYSFNLDGTAIYMTMASLFIAQAMNIDLTLNQKLTILAVLLLTSKGSAGVAGAGFVTLAATIESTRLLPVAGLALLLGVDRFMAEARSITNLIGNGVATVAIAKWDGALNLRRARRILDGETPQEADEPEAVLVPALSAKH
jgi:aerobic C4-dicarboxylate transport protein